MSRLSFIPNKRKTAKYAVMLASFIVSALSVWLYYTKTDSNSPYFLLIVIFADIILTFLMYIISDGVPSKSDEASSSSLTGITIDYVKKTNTPIVICRDGTIWWHNDAFGLINGRADYSGFDFEKKIGIPIDSIKSFDSQYGTEFVFRDAQYILRCCRIKTQKNDFAVVLFDNVTEIEGLRRKVVETEIFPIRIEADNIEELEESSGESVRNASLMLSNLLNKWVDENNGIIREYKSDKYLAFFDRVTINKFIENKFDILDSIREIKFGESNIPITVSIGVGLSGDKLSEKEVNMNDAFNTAIQRGGDQTVVKSSGDFQIYGGVTQTVQKKTKVRSKIYVNRLIECMQNSSNVIIQGHRFPDYDAIGSAIGIAALCDYIGKEYYIIADSTNPNFEECIGLISRIPWLDTEKAFISAGEATEYLNSESLCVCVDFSLQKIAECPELLDISAKTVYIDHHIKNPEFTVQPVFSYVEQSVSSTSELVSEMLEQSIPSNKMNEAVASLLYSGIELDTNHFVKNVGVRTLSAAMYLRARGANPGTVQQLFKTSEDDYIEDSRYGLNTVIYRDEFAITFNEKTINTLTAARAADRLLNVKKIKAAFALCRSDGMTHISARSTSDVNVSAVLAKLGGGGHFDSAGAKCETDIKETITLLLKAIDETVPQQKTKER